MRYGDKLCDTVINGHRLFLPDGDIVYASAIQTGSYERHVHEAICRLLSPGDTFIDVGANLGVHTLAAAACVGPSGKVYAIGADINNAAILQKTLDTYNVRNVLLIPVAVSERQGEQLLCRAEGSSNSLLRLHQEIANYNSIYVTSLDILLPNVTPSLIKLDIEGREGGALRGAEHIIRRSGCPIIAEYYSPERLPYPEQDGGYPAYLKSLGYSISVIEPDGSLKDSDGEPESLRADIARLTDQHHLDLLFQR